MNPIDRFPTVSLLFSLTWRVFLASNRHLLSESKLDTVLSQPLARAQDITEREQRSENPQPGQTSLILERMTDAFVSWDASWRYTYVNKEAERLLRVRREDLLGKSVWESFPEMIDSPFYAATHRVYASRQPETLEETMSGLGTWLNIRIFPEDAGGLSLHFQDITEGYETAAMRREMARFQKDFMQEVLLSATSGKLTLCYSTDEVPPPRPERFPEDLIVLTPVRGVRELRKTAEAAAEQVHFSDEAWFDLEISVGEAAMNAVVHAGGGEGIVSWDTTGGIIQVRIADHGKGITAEHLPRALLQQGFTTAGTMGQGFKMILQMVDRVWLLTDENGTVVVLEKERRRIS